MGETKKRKKCLGSFESKNRSEGNSVERERERERMNRKEKFVHGENKERKQIEIPTDVLKKFDKGQKNIPEIDFFFDFACL